MPKLGYMPQLGYMPFNKISSCAIEFIRNAEVKTKCELIQITEGEVGPVELV